MWAWESDDDFYTEEPRHEHELTPEEEDDLREAIEVIRLIDEACREEQAHGMGRSC